MTETKPGLVPGQKCVVAVEDLAFGGEGVARVGEFVVFVPFVLVGETVEIEVTEVKKRFARARLVRVVEPSLERVKPECRYFGECGGCQYQHMEYAAQLRLKRKQVRDIFERIGGFKNPPVSPVVPCPQPYGYRNRIMVRSQWDKFKRSLNIGFIRYDNRLVVDIEECAIASPELNRQLQEARLHPPLKGGIKVLLRQQPENWDVPPQSFFQNNFLLMPQLAETVRDCLRQSGARFLVDAYCGVGFFSLELAGQVESFVGVEYDQQAVQAARRNAAMRACTNGGFMVGLTEDYLESLLERFPHEATSVVLDPPRRGCGGKVIERLRQAGVRQVIYVSCHPATLARDLNIMCADGVYGLVKAVPLDMFPQTQHVECVADMMWNGSDTSGRAGR
ncbi:MAG: TRAM domain-containing protein [Candidatus Omnitrophica bacterium]|nr:TRAM domain-containing protein [Candidatus Omnitrophota bacterium]